MKVRVVIVAVIAAASMAAGAEDIEFVDKPYREGAAVRRLPVAPYPAATKESRPPSAGSAAASAPLPVASAPAANDLPKSPNVERWVIEPTDGSLSRALKRWSERSSVPLVWEAPKDKPAFRAEYFGSFDQAIENVMIDTGKTEYRLHACAFDNVVRILHELQPCKSQSHGEL